MDELIGREREQARLRALVDGAAGGGGAVALIRGEAGIGKTALARWVARLSRERDFVTLIGRAHPHGTLVSYGPLVEAFGRELRSRPPGEVAELVERIVGLSALLPGVVDEPDLGPVPDELALTRTLEAVRALLVRLAANGPVLLAIDDLQWADTATLRALTHMAGELDGAPILIVATLREGDDAERPDVRSTLASLRRLATVDELRPARLDATEVAAMLRRLSGERLDPDLVADIAARTAGTPLFVEALGRDLLQGRAGDAGGTAPPAEVQDAIAERLHDLDPTALALLAAISISTSDPAPELLRDVVGRSEEEVDGAIGLLAARHLVRIDDGPPVAVGLAHPLIGEVVETGLSPMERSRLHQRFLEVLGHDTDPEIRAAHLEGAGSRVPPEQAVEILLAAARQATNRQADRSAAAHAGRALELVEPLGRPERELTVRNELCAALLRLREYEAAGAVAREALLLDPDDPVLKLPAQGQVELVSWWRGGGENELTELTAALAEVPDHDVRPEVLGSFERSITAHARRGRPADAAAVAEELARRTDGRTEPPAVAANLIARCFRLSVERRFGEIWPLLAELDAVVRRTEAPLQSHRLRVLTLDAALVTGPLSRILDAAEGIGIRSDGAYLSWRDHAVGHLTGLAALDPSWASDERAASLELADSEVWRDPIVEAHRAWVLGDLEQALAVRRQVLDRSGGTFQGVAADRNLTLVDGFVTLIEGDASGARRLSETLRGRMPRAAIELIAGELDGRLALLAGDRETTARLIAQLMAQDGGEGWSSAHGAKLEALTRTGDARADALVGAADRFEAVGDRHQVARCLTGAAEAAPGRSGDERLGSLLGPVERAGLDRLAARMRQVLGLDATADRPRVLTRRQLEIAELVAEGLSNAAIADRLFISVRTVTSHLDHIYTRLGIGNRTELAVLLPDLR